MNIGTIVTPNVKGQIVIPKKIRDILGINENVALNVVLSEGGIYLHPVDEVLTQKERRDRLLKILKESRGILKGAPYYKNEKAMRKLELEAARKRKKAW